MGSYLSTPVVEKVSSDETSARLSYGASSMQGWREFQEDAHNCIIDFDTNTSLFAVYDGHGGAEVAKYCSLNLPDYLRSVSEYKRGNIGQGLEDTFLEFDSTLTKPEVVADLRRAADSDLPDEDDDSDEDAAMLSEEAHMPLDELIARYKGVLTGSIKITKKASSDCNSSSDVSGTGGAAGGSSSAFGSVANKVAPHVMKYHNEKPKSPRLHAKKSKMNTDSASSSSSNGKEEGEEEDSSEVTLKEDNNVNSPAATNGKGVVASPETVNGVSSSQSKVVVPKDETMGKKEAQEQLNNNKDASKKETNDAEKELNEEDATTTKTTKTIKGEAQEQKDELKKEAQADSSDGKHEITQSKKLLDKEIEDDGVSSTTVNGNLLDKKGNSDGKESSDVQPGCSKVSSSSSASSTGFHAGTGAVLSSSEGSRGDADQHTTVKKKRVALLTVPLPLTGRQQRDDDSDSDIDSEEDEDFKGPGSESSDEAVAGSDDESGKSEIDEDDDESSTSEEDVSECTMPQGEEPGQDSGCTAVVAVLRGDQLVVANAGDSRCVVCRAGEAVEMSFDHKPEDELESRRIVKAGGKVTSDGRVNGGLNLSRAIGDHSYKTNETLSLKEQMITSLPDIKQLKLDIEKDEFMVLACDGIWNVMSSQEVVDFVKDRISKDEKLSKICEEMFDFCMAPDTSGDGTGCDNMTTVIVKFHRFDQLEKKPTTEDEGGEKSKGKRLAPSSSSSSPEDGKKEDQDEKLTKKQKTDDC